MCFFFFIKSKTILVYTIYNIILRIIFFLNPKVGLKLKFFILTAITRLFFKFFKCFDFRIAFNLSNIRIPGTSCSFIFFYIVPSLCNSSVRLGACPTIFQRLLPLIASISVYTFFSHCS